MKEGRKVKERKKEGRKEGRKRTRNKGAKSVDTSIIIPPSL